MSSPWLEQYLKHCTPITPLIAGPTLTEEQSIKWLIDEAFKAGKLMIKTHYKSDIIRFIVLAQVLDGHGYNMIWYKGRGVVGARKKSDLSLPMQIANATKEVTERVEQRSNERSISYNPSA
jgi:hypothetical protein